MERATVLSIFQLAGVPVLDTKRLENAYWPAAYKEEILANPWWFVRTPHGWIEVGRRKRVFSVEWKDTPFRKYFFPEDSSASQDLHYCHVASVEEIISVLKKLFKE